MDARTCTIRGQFAGYERTVEKAMALAGGMARFHRILGTVQPILLVLDATIPLGNQRIPM